MENGASAADLRLVEWLVRMLVVVVADEILPVARGGVLMVGHGPF